MQNFSVFLGKISSFPLNITIQENPHVSETQVHIVCAEMTAEIEETLQSAITNPSKTRSIKPEENSRSPTGKFQILRTDRPINKNLSYGFKQKTISRERWLLFVYLFSFSFFL